MDPYLITLSKRGFYAFNMKEKVKYFVTGYYEDAIEAAVIDEEKKEIITGDRGKKLVRWRYGIDGGGRLFMQSIDEVTLAVFGNSERRKSFYSIQSIVKWQGNLLSVSETEIFTDVNLIWAILRF